MVDEINLSRLRTVFQFTFISSEHCEIQFSLAKTYGEEFDGSEQRAHCGERDVPLPTNAPD